MKRSLRTAFAAIVALTFATMVFATEPAKPAARTKLVDINYSTETQLKAVPGVGDEYAKKIIAGRPYKSIDELKTRNIMPADSYEKIKKLIRALC